MQKLINNRIFVFIALGLCLGIFVAVTLYAYAALFAVPIFIAVFTVCYFFRADKGGGFTALRLFVLSLCAFIAGSVLSLLAIDNLPTESRKNVTIEAVVERVDETAASKKLTLKSISTADGGIVGKAVLLVDKDGNIERGDIISLVCDLNVRELVTEEGAVRTVNAAFARRKLFYDAEQKGQILIVGKSFDLRQSVRSFVWDKLCENAEDASASVAYAVLFGDTAKMDFYALSALREAGIGHIFAVSGLHVGVLCAFLYFLLKRLPKKLCFSLIAAVLFFYVYLCDFSPSSMRAFVMICYGFVAKIKRRVHDSATSLAISAIVILLFSPLVLFDLGFRLSCFSIFLIFALAPPIKRALFSEEKRLGDFDKRAETRRNTLSTLIAVQLGMTLLTVRYFGYVSVFSLFINFLFVPVVSFCYVGLFATTLLSLCGVNITFLFTTALGGIADFIARLWDFGALSVSADMSAAALLFFFFALFFVTDFCRFGRKRKIICSVFSAAIAVILSV